MAIEDYNKYYIQGSGHYLIPKDELKFLLRENEELKLQLKGTTHCFDEEEHEKLKKQLEENKDKINWYENFEVNKTIDKLRLKHNTQQKEFINYMNKTIEELECDDVDDEEMKGYLIQRIDTFKEILSKYKEIKIADLKRIYLRDNKAKLFLTEDDKKKFTNDYIDNHNVKR